MKNILCKMDKLLCDYFGFDKIEIIPHFLIEKSNTMLVLNTESFKRHTQLVTVDKMDLQFLNPCNKAKLGKALGKMIAKDVVVSFDDVKITLSN